MVQPERATELLGSIDLDPGIGHIKSNRTERFEMIPCKECMMNCAEMAPRGRTAAGQDPAKRDQILDGAKRCFLRLGFENASMNEITAEAGVSKGTIYVYFQNKEARTQRLAGTR
jgi:hypothetical protein